MTKLQTAAILPEIAEILTPFLDRVLDIEGDSVESIYLLGGAAAGEYHGAQTELNSLMVVDQMDLDLVGSIGVIGRHYAGTNITAPVLMTESYMIRSTDVFPVEFLNMKSSHAKLYGKKDVVAALKIDPEHLRLQVERELKARLVGLRSAFISAAAGDALIPFLAGSVSSYYPVFKALLYLKQYDLPKKEMEILRALKDAFGIDSEPLQRVQSMAWGSTPAEADGVDPLDLFRDFYDAIRAFSEVADGLG